MKRAIQPEVLDELTPSDPLAIHSRRDLQLLNRIMGHAAIMSSVLRSIRPSTESPRIVELGAGDGAFMLQLARLLSPQWKGVHVVLVDRANCVAPETKSAFVALGWSVESVTADVFDWLQNLEGTPADAIIANLFLHHFPPKRLEELLLLAAEHTRVFAACEPRRSYTALVFSRLVGLIGCNAVTRHDAVVSVRAGFGGLELSELWPQRSAWRLQERRAGLFTHAFVARRLAEPNGHASFKREELSCQQLNPFK